MAQEERLFETSKSLWLFNTRRSLNGAMVGRPLDPKDYLLLNNAFSLRYERCGFAAHSFELAQIIYLP